MAQTPSPIDATSTYRKVHMDIAGELEGQAEARLDDLRSGAAWDGFCDAVRTVGHGMLASEFAGDDLERAEGHRYLLGLLTLRLNRLLYACGPKQPAFVRAMDDILKFGLDNPDGINSKSATSGSAALILRTGSPASTASRRGATPTAATGW